MIRSLIIMLGIILPGLSVFANNVRIQGDVNYNVDELVSGNILHLKFTLEWENSWRDDYNWDAVYVCFKYKVMEPSDTYTWHHIYPNEMGTVVNSVDFECSMATANASGQGVKNTGIFVHRKFNGGGNASVDVVVAWDITSNTKQALDRGLFERSKVMVSAVGVEMVYVPTGAFKLGDSQSEKTFRRAYTPIPEQYDIVSNEYETLSSGGVDEHPEWASDRINDNEPNSSSCWMPKTGNGVKWRIDFGENQADRRTIRYFGVNASKGFPNNKPTRWALYGSNDKSIVNMADSLWSGGPNDWVVSDDAYPIEHAIKVKNPQPYRYYHIYIFGMQQGTPVVKSIGMSDQSVDQLLDYSVLVDSPEIPIDSLKGLGARDGENWSVNTPYPNYPNGFSGFYAMKYEISQEQYVKFLNKLTRTQQDALLPDIKKSNLSKGSFVFGNPKKSSARNGIVIADIQANKPYVFSDSLEIATGDDLSINGETIACNFMSVNDMLAYADWMGLRPLSELEYEKISRRPFPVIPLKHEYAWNSDRISLPGGIANPGRANETAVGGNANYGNVAAIGGPLRVGAFASGKSAQENAGVGFYGAMDLSGNLSEIYYNANVAGRKLNAFSDLSHGDGYLNATTGLTDIAVSTWPNGMDAFAVRGGSYKDSDKFLAVSDRTRNKNYLTVATTRDSTVSFRLGYSMKRARNTSELDVYLTLQNGKTSKNTGASDTICGYISTYTIVGNKPAVQGSHTFIWYMLEDGGAWRILEGENDPGLTYSKFVNNLSRLKKYQFKRLMITPINYAMTAPVTIVVDQVANAQISSLVDTIDAFGISQGGFYVASAIPSEFTWRWIYRGRVQTLAPYASSPTHSHYVPDPLQFRLPDGKISYGENLVQMERSTKGVNSCFTTVDLSVFIKEDKPETIAASQNVRCGNYMKDERDGEVYPTVAIGAQCWMGRNLNWNGGGGTCYAGNANYCKIFGRMYTWKMANTGDLSNNKKKGICPNGWHMPSNAEWKTLINAMSEPGKKLKSSRYWAFVDNSTGMSYVGSDDKKFGALPGGSYMFDKNYNDMNYSAGWWTSQVGTWSYSVVVSGGYWWCPNHGYGHGTWYPYVYSTRYNYDGYYVGMKYNSNSVSDPNLFRVNKNGYDNDKLYVRCLKD